MENKNGCVICGAELICLQEDKEVTCYYCGKNIQSMSLASMITMYVTNAMHAQAQN